MEMVEGGESDGAGVLGDLGSRGLCTCVTPDRLGLSRGRDVPSGVDCVRGGLRGGVASPTPDGPYWCPLALSRFG